MDYMRRSFLGTAAAAGAVVGLAGCLGGDETPDPPVAGDPDADVTVTVYEDFSCQFCRDFKEDVYPQLETEYLEPGRIRYEHRDFPIVDEWSWSVADAAREIYETEGDDAFFAFADEIYEHMGSYSYDAIESVASDLGLDGAGAREAAEEETHRSTIEASQSYGQSNGVEGTPTVHINGEPVDLQAIAFDQVAVPIEQALEE